MRASVTLPNTRVEKILILDESPQRAEVYARILQERGFEVHRVENLADSFSDFTKLQPSLVIVDLSVCRLDECDIVGQIKQESAANLFVPILLASDENENKLLKLALAQEADGFLKIPFSDEVLLAKIESLLRMRQLNVALKDSRDKLHELHQGLQQEHKDAERIYEKFVRPSSQEIAGFKSYISAASIFNGDLLIAKIQPSGDVVVLLGDFTGHGLSAAIGVVPVAEMFNGMVAKARSVPEIIVEINSKLHRILPAHLFFGCTILQVSPAQRKARVYNCGMPDVLMVKHGEQPRRFPSKNLPLGVVDSKRLDLYPESVELDGDECFYLLTDGVVESRNPKGEMFGYHRVEQAIARSHNGIDSLIQQATLFCDGQFFEDDVSIAELHTEEILNYNYIDSLGNLTKAASWKLQYHFDHMTLKQMQQPMEGVVDTIMMMQPIPSHKERLFMVLDELFNNALEHGVLGLDSSLKQKEDGFLQFLTKRQQNLENLKSGFIELQISHKPVGEYEGEMTIKVHDSGNGFDFKALEQAQQKPSERIFSGRGIMLTRSLCQSVEYQGKGNAVKVVYHWSLKPQKNE